METFYQVISGLMQSHESELRSEEAAAYLFAHEASRVFHDRLMDDKDRELFHHILSTELQIHFKVGLILPSALWPTVDTFVSIIWIVKYCMSMHPLYGSVPTSAPGVLDNRDSQ